MNSSLRFAISLAVLSPALSGTAFADNATPFLYSIAGQEGGAEATGTASAAVLGGSVGVNTSYGSQSLTVMSPAGQTPKYVGSVWSDSFVIGSGGGTGKVTVEARVTGTVLGNVDMSYAFFVSTNPFSLDTINSQYSLNDYNPTLPGALRLLYTGIENFCPADSAGCGKGVPFENFQGNFSRTLLGSIDIQLGTRYYVASVVSSDVSESGGIGTFQNSLRFGLPSAAPVSVASGTAYNLMAAPVPEPETYAMLMAGLGVLGAVARRRKQAAH